MACGVVVTSLARATATATGVAVDACGGHVAEPGSQICGAAAAEGIEHGVASPVTASQHLQREPQREHGEVRAYRVERYRCVYESTSLTHVWPVFSFLYDSQPSLPKMSSRAERTR